MKSLSITTTIQETKEVEVPIPCFMRNLEQTEYMAVLDENTVVKLVHRENFSYVLNTGMSEYQRKELGEKWIAPGWFSATETEFLDKYDAVIESMSLHPKLAV